jgi:hypothetical protein
MTTDITANVNDWFWKQEVTKMFTLLSSFPIQRLVLNFNNIKYPCIVNTSGANGCIDGWTLKFNDKESFCKDFIKLPGISDYKGIKDMTFQQVCYDNTFWCFKRPNVASLNTFDIYWNMDSSSGVWTKDKLSVDSGYKATLTLDGEITQPIIMEYIKSDESNESKVQCCSQFSNMSAKDRTICGYTSYDISSGPTSECDTVMATWCADKTSNPICGCYKDSDYDKTTTEGKIYKYYSTKNPSVSKKECLLEECRTSIAYKTIDQQSIQSCPQTCGFIQNVNIGSFASLDYDQQNSVRCDGKYLRLQNKPCKLPLFIEGGKLTNCKREQSGYIPHLNTCNIVPTHGYNSCGSGRLVCNDGNLDQPVCTKGMKCDTSLLKDNRGFKTTCNQSKIDSDTKCEIVANNNYKCDVNSTTCDNGMLKIPNCTYEAKSLPVLWKDDPTKKIIIVGSSNTNKKTITLDKPNLIVNNIPVNTLNDNIFTVVVFGNKLIVTNTTHDGGWSDNLSLYSVEPRKPPTGWIDKEGFSVLNVGASASNSITVQYYNKTDGIIVDKYPLNQYFDTKFTYTISTDNKLVIKKATNTKIIGWEDDLKLYMYFGKGCLGSEIKATDKVDCPDNVDDGDVCKIIPSGFTCTNNSVTCKNGQWQYPSNRVCTSDLQKYLIVGSYSLIIITPFVVLLLYLYFKRS